MNCTSGLTVGYIPYLNCVPCFHYLRECGFVGGLVPGVPSALNSLLQQGRLDVSPSSSFEYARHWRDYVLLPGHSISSIGKVESVLLFSPVDPSQLNGQQISITGESATSINLLRLILHEFYGLDDVTDVVPDSPVETAISQQKPALLIGDRALQMAGRCLSGMKIFDLGEIWYQQTGLPFVFALWMIRRDALGHSAERLSRLPEQLACSYQRVMGNPLLVARQQTATSGLTPQQIVAYWHSINYRLESPHLAGLRLYFDLCAKYKLLVDIPQLEFFQTPAIADTD